MKNIVFILFISLLFIAPEISFSQENDDMYFIAQEGDRCDNLANRFYGNPNLWWFLAKVNNLTTMNIPVGTSLRIPATLQYAVGR